MAERMARRRVKLYALNPERQWDDRGTGHVTSTYVERLKGMSLLVRAETDGTPLLESKIQTDTAYQKQQGTLIVWSEGDNFDLALSFQEKAGCDEIWEKICQVQGKDPSVDFTQEVVDESEEERFEEVNDSNLWVELPPCELGKLGQINELLAASLHNVNRQDKIATTIENESYIKKLIDLFRLCEDLDNRESLHTLYEIFKNIFLLNKNSLLEVLCAEENIFDVVGILEYDPTCVRPKKHRDFLKSLSKFNEVIPMENSELVNKIHQTYRVQYIQDVALPNQAVYEENMPSTLSSFIFFNKIEIVTVLSEDERFLSELFVQLGSEDISIEKRRDLILFLKEFCTFSQTLQPPNRENFYKTLSSFGVLGALECTLAVDEPVVKAASVDVLGFFVEFSPSMVRDYMLQQQHKVEEEHYLLNIMLEQMVVDCDPEMGGAVQLMGILRILIDPENMLATNNKAERADFLAFFYKHSMHYLIAPLLSNTAGDVVVREDYQTAQLVALILELLAFCVEHHSYHIKNYIIHRDLLRRVMVLMKSKHTFLVLSAVRFIRKIIGMRDEFYNRHIISCNLFAPLVDAYVRNNARYNLLDSAILEIFEFMKTEDIKSLTMYSMEKFGDVFNRIEYVQTFTTLRTRYNQHQDKIRDREKSTAAVQGLGMVRATTPGNAARYRRDMRDMEAEEEMWFSSDDCDEEYHSPLKQELLKGSGGVVAADIEESLDDDEEEGALFGATSPDPHRLTATPLLRETDKLSKECVADTDSSVAGVVLDDPANVEEEEDKVAPHSPASGVSVSCSLHRIIKPCNSKQLCSQDPAGGGVVPYDSADSPLARASAPLDAKAKATSFSSSSSSPVSFAAANNAAILMGAGGPGRKISLVDYDENSDEEEEELEMETSAGSSPSPEKVSSEVVALVEKADAVVADKDAAAPVAKTPVVSADEVARKPSDEVPKQDQQDDAETALLVDATEEAMDTTAHAVDSNPGKVEVGKPKVTKAAKAEGIREKVVNEKNAEDAVEASVDAIKSNLEVTNPAQQDADDKESKQKSPLSSSPGKAANAKSPEKKSSPAKEVKENGEKEQCLSPPKQLTAEPAEVSSETRKDDKEEIAAVVAAKESETEKKRVRSAEEGPVSESVKSETNVSAAKSALVASVEDEGGMAESDNTKACAANGVASDADGLAEGEAMRKRPRLAAD